MLSPYKRMLFLDALRPPAGYEFDRGIGTTFTLDMFTLLVAPLSMALFDCTSVEDALKDPLLLLESLRKNAGRLTVFCNAGHISVPKDENYLFRYLEDMVVEVQAPKGGYFHPKVWLMRYVAEGLSPRYRLLNLSRNLTFDRSWDLMVQLDGNVASHRTRGFAQNRPLSDFVEVLPKLAVHKPSSRVHKDIKLISAETRKMVFDIPEGFDDHVAFFPSGIEGHRRQRFNRPMRRVMVLSPFLTPSFLNRITKEGSNHLLISRPDSIDNLSPQVLDRFGQILVLADGADLEPAAESVDPEGMGTQENGRSDRGIELSGLHAKLFIIEDRKDATWLIGSANATNAAFVGRNVELMLELKGRKRDVGIKKTLGSEDDESSLRALLTDYRAGENSPQDEDQVRVEMVTDRVRDWVVAEKMTITVEPATDDRHNIVINRTTGRAPPDGDFQMFCWPISIPNGQKNTIRREKGIEAAYFEHMSTLSLTPFIAYQIEAKENKASATAQFVLKLPISGLPELRDDIIFTEIISNQMQFLRYLRLLLAGEYALNLPDFVSGFGWDVQGQETSWEDLDLPLLEDMVRALSRSPEEKIDRIGEIVDRLRRTPKGGRIIPEEFDHLWETIIAARNEIK